MTSAATYHLDPFYSNRLLDVKLVVVNIFAKVRNLLHSRFVTLKNHIISTTNSDLSKIYMMVEGMENIIKKMDADQAKKAYPIIAKSIKKFNWYYGLLEDIQFFNNEETKDLSENILLMLYDIEGKLRMVSFDADPRIDCNDEELKNAATRISLNSLTSLHAAG